MTTTIFINFTNKSKILQEIEFANSLLELNNFQKTFFEKVSKKPKELTKAYIDFYNQHNCIVIPKNLSNRKLSLFEKHFLRHPENIFKYPTQIETFADLILVKEATLLNLDNHLSKYFNTGYRLSDRVYVLNTDERLAQFSDVILGIGSPKIVYKDTKTLSTYRLILKRELEMFAKEREDLKNYSIYFTLGTTAISTKGLKI